MGRVIELELHLSDEVIFGGLTIMMIISAVCGVSPSKALWKGSVVLVAIVTCH